MVISGSVLLADVTLVEVHFGCEEKVKELKSTTIFAAAALLEESTVGEYDRVWIRCWLLLLFMTMMNCAVVFD